MFFDNPILNLTYDPRRPYYPAARDSILKLAETIPGMKVLDRHPHPLRGDTGEELSTEEIYYGPEEPKWFIILITGIHGVEAITGSALLYEAMKATPSLTAMMPEPTGVLFIHTLNPYGASYARRANHENVDPNRNFVEHPFVKPSPIYDELYDAINPVFLDPASELYHWTVIGRYVRRHGLQPLVQTLAEGQFHHRKGLQYGGDKPTRENILIRKLIPKRVPKSVKVCVVIDGHCGLGPKGLGSILSGYKEEARQYQQLRNWYGTMVQTPKQVEVFTTNPGNLGAIDEAIEEELKKTHPDISVYKFAYELGVLGSDIPSVITVARAERESNWAWHRGRYRFWCGGKVKKIVANMWKLFYQEDPQWRQSIPREGMRMFTQTFCGLAASEYTVHYSTVTTS